MSMVKQKKQKYLITVITACVVAAVALVVTPFAWRTEAAQRNISTDNVVNFEPAADEARYLSDYNYLPGSKTAYGSIQMDKTGSDAKLTLKYDNSPVVFEKGIWAHAASNVYYDLDAIRNGYEGYDHLMAYVGLNTTSTAGNGVIFWIYGSNNEDVANGQALTGAQNWDVIYNSESKVTTPGSNAELIDIDVSEYRFVRLQVSDNGGNEQDHSVWADIKLVKDGYQPYAVPEVGELDAQIKNTANLDVLNNADHEIAILRRDLVKNAGQYTLTAFINSSEENRETMNWLYNNVDVLRMYTTGGKPTGTYAQSLEVLSQLYHAYRDDLNNNNRLKTAGLNGTQGEMYLKMMISISLTHSKQIRFWIRDQGAMAGNADSPNLSRPLDRYMVYKRMYNADKLQTNVFESLEVEEMRYVMMTELGDDELEWLRDWLPTIGKGLYTHLAASSVY